MKKVFCMVAIVAIAVSSFAQTADELKVEREALKSEINSKDGQKLESAWAKLSTEEVPQTTNVASVDALVLTNVSLRKTLIATENILGEYKIQIIETKDGEVDIDKHVAKLEDYLAQLPLLVAAGEEAAVAAQKVKEVQNDLKQLNPVSAMSSIKAGKWAISATDVNVKMIERETKMLNNLINSCKAAKNL